MKFEEMVKIPLKEEKNYYNSLYKIKNAEKYVPSLICDIGKTMLDVRAEIKWAEDNGTLMNPIVNKLSEDIESQNFKTFFPKYINTWLSHDIFSTSIAPELDKRVSCKPEETLELLLINDTHLRAYVALGMGIQTEKLHEIIKTKTGYSFIPPTKSFEMTVLEDVFDAHKNRNSRAFADKYCYGDLEFAEKEIEKIYSTDIDKTLKKSREKRRDIEEEFDKQLAKIKDIDTLEAIHYFVRMSHWTGFEEPRKRYKIEGGMVDYLFREKLFQRLKNENPTHPSLSKATFGLQIDQNTLYKIAKTKERWKYNG